LEAEIGRLVKERADEIKLEKQEDHTRNSQTSRQMERRQERAVERTHGD
jgi:hypothetical protein